VELLAQHQEAHEGSHPSGLHNGDGPRVARLKLLPKQPYHVASHLIPLVLLVPGVENCGDPRKAYVSRPHDLNRVEMDQRG